MKNQNNDDGPRLQIDEHRLDEEWTGQPKLYYKWAAEHAEAILAVDTAKTTVDLVKAELDQEIRANPEKYGISKITETVVTTTILGDPEYQAAMKKVNVARYEVNIVAAAVVALEHRKRALEKLVDLHGRNYFSEPKASEQSRETMDQVEKRSVRNKARRKLNQ